MLFFSRIFIFMLMFIHVLPTVAQQNPMYGIFMIVKGDVIFQNPHAKRSKAYVGAKVFEGSIITTIKESRAKIVMADRNVFNLAPNTQLIIQKYENSDQQKNATLTLDEGQVRINVEQKYDDQNQKFQIKTPTVVAGVRGTQFLASYKASAKESQIVTFAGSVSMTSLNGQGLPVATVVVNKGQTSSAQSGLAPEAPRAVPKEQLKELDKSSRISNTSTTGAPTNEPPTQNTTTTTGAKPDNSPNTSSPPPPPAELRTKEIAQEMTNAPPEGGSAPTVLLPPPPPSRLPIIPPPTDFARDAIQTQNSKTKVIINVK